MEDGDERASNIPERIEIQNEILYGIDIMKSNAHAYIKNTKGDQKLEIKEVGQVKGQKNR